MISNATYQSYVLRFWRDNPQGVWRASLHSTADNEKFVFATKAELFNFLLARLLSDEDIRTEIDPPTLPMQHADDEAKHLSHEA